MAARGNFGRSATWTGESFATQRSGGQFDPDDSDLDDRSSSGVDDADEDDTLRRWRHEALQRSTNGRPSTAEMRWVGALKGYLGGTEAPFSEEAAEKEVQAELRRLLEQRTQPASSSPAQQDGIPPFFRGRPAEGSLAGQVARLARTRFLRKQHDALLDPEELSVVWGCLKESISGPDDDPAKDRINYDDFCQVGERSAEQIGAKVKPFFAPSVFLTFEADQYGRIGIYPFYLYMMRMTSLTQARIDMCVFDEDGDGYLTHTELEAYIGQLIPSLPQLASSDLAPGGSFVNMYKKIAARKFFFFLDGARRSKLLIRHVLLHPVLSELMELRQDEPDEVAPGNWFLPDNARRVYTLFMKLDRDRNGTLSKQELAAWNDGGLTPIFVDRVFDEHVRRSRLGRGHPREMDVASFVDFVLAMDYKSTPEALAYLFRCLDLRGQGALTAADVYTLFKAVHEKWMAADNYELVVQDVVDEVWDMVKPAHPARITLPDLLACKQGDTVVSMLTDVRGFWQHDNRETLAQQQDDEEGGHF